MCFEVLSQERFSSIGFVLLFSCQEANRWRGKASQAVARVIGQVVAERVLAHKMTVCTARYHSLVVLEHRVKRLQRDGLESGAPGRTRTRNPLIRSQVLYPLSYRCMCRMMLMEDIAENYITGVNSPWHRDAQFTNFDVHFSQLMYVLVSSHKV